MTTRPSRPQPGEAWGVLVTGVNRVNFDSMYTAREITAWPALSRPKFHVLNDYGRVVFAERPPADAPQEGFQRLLDAPAHTGNALREDYRGMSRPWIVRSPQDRVGWRAAPLPTEERKFAAYAFTGVFEGKGSADGGAPFTLWFNDEPLLDFNPYEFETNTQWSGSGARLDYRHRPGTRHASGVFVVVLPKKTIAGGGEARFAVTLADPDRTGVFRVHERTDTALWEHCSNPPPH